MTAALRRLRRLTGLALIVTGVAVWPIPGVPATPLILIGIVIAGREDPFVKSWARRLGALRARLRRA